MNSGRRQTGGPIREGPGTKTVRVLLINDNSAHPNWGAQATPFALKRILQRSVPGVEIEALSWDWLRRRYRRLCIPIMRETLWNEDSWRGLRPVLFRLSTPADFFPPVADDFDTYADDWLAGRGGPQAVQFLNLAREADVVVYNGENSIYRNTEEGCHSLFLLWVAKTRLGKPSCIVNHTADLNEVRPIMNGMVQLVDPVLDLVATREPCSLRNLEGLGVHNAVLFPDVVFGEDPAEVRSNAFELWRRKVGLGDQPYFCFSGSGLPVSAPGPGRDGAAGELVRAIEALGVRPVFLARDPHCLFLEEVARRVGGVYFGPEHEFAELWPLFKDARFLVTGHFHYAIIGAMVGCPFVPLSTNNHKMRGVCELLRWRRTEPFDITWLRGCGPDVIAEAAKILEDRESLSAHLLERSAELRAEAQGLGERIAEISRSARASAPSGAGGKA